MTWPHPSTNPPSYQPNYTPTHGWGNLHRFQIFKKNWNISISSSAIEFWLILGVPPGGGGWADGGQDGERVPYTCAHAHTHTHACVYDIIGNSQGFPQWGRPFAWNYHVYLTCMCVPPTTPPPSTHTLPPRAEGSPNHQNLISPELIEIIQFCLKILYLWTFLNSYRL